MILHYFRILMRSWRLVAITALLAWIISLGISLNTVPLYRASATFIISPNANLISSRDVVTSLDTLEGRNVISTYGDILSSRRVFEDAARALNLEFSSLQAYQRQTVVKTNSNILELIVEGPNPDTAALLANNIGQNGINYIKGIYQVFDIAFLDQATPPLEPFAPRALRSGLIFTAAGLLIGMLAAILKEQLRAPLEALRLRSITDRTSSAFNLRHFKRLLEQELARSPQEPLALGLIELEGLQDLVEILPEAALSNLLHHVVSVLRQQLRGNDLVGRWDATSFAVLLPATPASAAARTLDRLRLVLADPVEFDDTRDKVSLMPSAGLAARLDDETASILIQQAEVALERSHQSGQQTVLYSDKEEKGGQQ